jgi:hypothetical protein
LNNLEASHVQDVGDEVQARLFRTCDRLVQCFVKMIELLLPFHCCFRDEGAKMSESRLAELLTTKEGRSVPQETIETLRLLKEFTRLAPARRREMIDLVEQYLRRQG